MFIETEGTPNPGDPEVPARRSEVMGAGTADFANAARTAGAQPARQPPFSSCQGVARVFLGGDFITVTKTDDDHRVAGPASPQVLGALIVEHFVAGRPIVDGAEADAAARGGGRAGGRGDRRRRSRSCWIRRVRPAVAGDGGDIVFRGYREGVVRLHMQGACSGCPSSSRATLKHGIENMLRHYVPEVLSVEQVTA